MAESSLHPAPSRRTVWVDVCKGLCITLVVYGHVSGGLEAAGALAGGSVWLVIRNWVYLFHMPAFFFLSGLYAGRRDRLPVGDFFRGKTRTLVYPYFVWTTVYLATQFVMVRFVNHGPDVPRALRCLVEPYGYGLWFLYALFLVSVVHYALVRLGISSLALVIIAAGLWFASAANWLGFWPILNTAMAFYIFYALAAWRGEQVIPSGFMAKSGLLFASGLALFVILTLLFLSGLVVYPAMRLLAALIGIAAVIGVSAGLAGRVTSRFWALLGLFSLEIYLGHPLWSTLARAGLGKAGAHSAGVLIFTCVVFGVMASLLVGLLCRRWRFPYLFRWPTASREK